MYMPPRVREHIALMSRIVLATSGVGGVAGLYGVYRLIHETHHRSGWFWLSLGFALLFVAQIKTVQRALRERDTARHGQDAAVRERDERHQSSVTGVSMGDCSHFRGEIGEISQEIVQYPNEPDRVDAKMHIRMKGRLGPPPGNEA
jgi:hypothetical protein